jgi:RNA polymerase sigma factor (sigma-70 family)
MTKNKLCYESKSKVWMEQINCFKAGDKMAGEKLYHEFAALISHVATQEKFYLVFGKEDAVSEARRIFFDLLKRYPYEDARRLPGLIQKEIYFKLINLLIKKRQHDVHEFSTDFTSSEAQEQADNSPLQLFTQQVEVELLKTDLQRMVQAALSKLSEQEREVVVLNYYESKKTHEIAKQMGLSNRRVFTLKASAKEKLRKYLDKGVLEG